MYAEKGLCGGAANTKPNSIYFNNDFHHHHNHHRCEYYYYLYYSISGKLIICIHKFDSILIKKREIEEKHIMSFFSYFRYVLRTINIHYKEICILSKFLICFRKCIAKKHESSL